MTEPGTSASRDLARNASGGDANATVAATVPSLLDAACPVEGPGDVKWWPAALRTVGRLFRDPARMFRGVREPVTHSRIVALLATVRLPLWGLTIAALGIIAFTGGLEPRVHDRALGLFVAPPIVEALSVWLMLLVPLGLPAMYFFGGLLAHLGLSLTGGAHRSVGASMRAFGLAVVPVLLLVGLLDIPLYLGLIGPMVYFGVLRVALLADFVLLALALSWTHRVSVIRCFLVAPLPIALLMGAIGLRALTVLPHLPGQPPAPTPDYVLTDL